MAKRSARGGTRPTSTAAQVSAGGRQLHTTVAALHTGATATATIGGLALYTVLAQMHVASIVAVIAGLLFALLGRMAMVSLGREWLVRMAARRQAIRGSGNARGSGTPSPKPATPRH